MGLRLSHARTQTHKHILHTWQSSHAIFALAPLASIEIYFGLPLRVGAGGFWRFKAARNVLIIRQSGNPLKERAGQIKKDPATAADMRFHILTIKSTTYECGPKR